MTAAELRAIASRAIADCDAEPLTRAAAAALPAGPAFVVAAGKAAMAMAQGLLAARPEVRGLVVTKDGHAPRPWPPGLEAMFAGHPLPDERSAAAGRRLVAALAALSPEESVVALLSGGASALLCLPVDGLRVEHVREASAVLLGAGVPIETINAVRGCLSATAWGGLARARFAAHPDAAAIHVLLLSDVLTGGLGTVGSGPFASPPRASRALAAARAVRGLSPAVRAVLARPPASGPPPWHGRVHHRVLADHHLLVDRAVAHTAALLPQARVVVLPSTEAEITLVARRLLEAARTHAPCVVVSGGEPSVRLPEPPGHGGRCQALALHVAEAIASQPDTALLAIASDGTDGPTDAAGALVDGDTWACIERAGVDPAAALARADAYPALDAAGALVRTGPTGTNVLDLHLLAVGCGQGGSGSQDVLALAR